MDKSGNATIRDRFPITCQLCGGPILTTQWIDGKQVQEAQEYTHRGIAHIEDAWISLYQHRHQEDCAATPA